MLNVELKRVISITNGTVIHGDINKYGKRLIKSICYDSRNADGDSIFVPIAGEKVDGHKFIPQVLNTECFASFTERDDIFLGDSCDKILIKVDNVIDAVQTLAADYRRSINVPVVGITGSVGKTTTREMVSLALSAGKKVYATPGNKNSQIGTPHTLFGYMCDAEICVFEMGMSMPGEMNRLAGMVRPDVALFTNIGVTHIENLGSRDAILAEKMHITDYMSEGSLVIINNDNDLLHHMSLKKGLSCLRYGLGEDCDVYATDIDESNGYPTFTAVVNGKRISVRLNTYGTFQIYNALAGLAVADYFGIDLSAAAEKLSEYTGFSHRNQILKNNDITVIDDTYNAAPDSMKAALDMLSSIACEGHRIAVLADMKELGEISEAAHIEIGEYARRKGNIDLLITYGPLAKGICKGFRGTEADTMHTEDADELERMILKNVSKGDLVLFKGSNSMRLFDYIDKVMNNELM